MWGSSTTTVQGESVGTKSEKVLGRTSGTMLVTALEKVSGRASGTESANVGESVGESGVV
jgi:hypothetical protein